MRQTLPIIFAVLIVASSAPDSALAEDARARPAASARRAYTKPHPMSFVRIRRSDNGRPAALQVANVRYTPVDGSDLSVTLYGAVHVGDAAYYDQLNKNFRQHDAVLYELASDPQGLKDRHRDEPGMFSMFQMDLGESLGLTKQLDAIDYERPNFVHADMPLMNLVEHAQSEGEDLLTITTQTLLDVQRMINRGDDPMAGLLGTGQNSGAQVAELSTLSNDPRQMKITLAEQLANQTQGGIFEGITVLDRYLINARNQRCLEVLDREINGNKADFGIFYGAGHNPDFHRRLVTDYGLKPVEIIWVDAWNLDAPIVREGRRVRELSEEELLMELIRRMLEGE